MDLETAIRKNHALNCYTQTNRHREKEEDWNAAKLFSTAAQFLRDNARRDNFFLWVDCFDPHEPWDAPPEFVKMYDKTPGYDGTIDPRAFHVRTAEGTDPAVVERVRDLYRAKVSFVDKWLGVFLDALEETGLGRNTMLVLTADHGTNLADRGVTRFHKSAPPGENEAHVPFIVSAPDAGAGESDMLVQPQDVFALAMAQAGVPSLPDGVESFDVLQAAREGAAGPRRIALSGNGVPGWGHRGPDAVLFSAFDREWVLGVAANPEHCTLRRTGEADDVASEHPDVVARLHAAAVDEMEHRELDAGVVAWLRGHGREPFPASVRGNDAAPLPPGWYNDYWRNMNDAFMIRD
jgi:hypothetical protein